MAASGQYPAELPEVLEFAVGDEIIGIRGGVLFRASTDALPSGGGVTVVQVIENETDTVPSSAVLYQFAVDVASALDGKVDDATLNDYATTAALDDKANLDSPVFVGTPQAPTAATSTNDGTIASTAFVQAVVTDQVAGLWKDQGNFDASGGSWPTSANTVALDAIKAGYLWKVSVAGTLTGGIILSVGDFIRALVDNAGNTAVDWAANEANIGYVPENQANKATDLTSPDNTKYPTTLAVSTALAGVSSEVVINTINTGTVTIQANKSHEINAYGSFILNADSISPRRRIKIKNISTSTLVNVTLTTGVVSFFERDGSAVTTLSLERGTEIDIVNLGGASNAIFRSNQVGPFGSFKILAIDTQNIGLSFDLTSFGTNYTWTAPAANINFGNLDFVANTNSNSRSGTRTSILGGQFNTVSGTDNSTRNCHGVTLTGSTTGTAKKAQDVIMASGVTLTQVDWVGAKAFGSNIQAGALGSAAGFTGWPSELNAFNIPFGIIVETNGIRGIRASETGNQFVWADGFSTTGARGSPSGFNPKAILAAGKSAVHEVTFIYTVDNYNMYTAVRRVAVGGGLGTVATARVSAVQTIGTDILLEEFTLEDPTFTITVDLTNNLVIPTVNKVNNAQPVIVQTRTVSYYT